MRLIVIDIGSLSTKGCLIGDRGELLYQHSVPHPIESPQPGWAEQDGETIWWRETVEVVQQLLKHPAAGRVDGLGVTGLFPALLATDETGIPLRPAILYADKRASRELEEFSRAFGSGGGGYNVAPQLAWLATNEPEVIRRVRRIFSSHNYIVYRLTGAYYLDYKVAAAYGAILDTQTFAWRREIAEWAGVDVNHLPGLCSAGEIVGQVTSEAAELTGLPAGLPVIAGSGDSLMTFLSSGLFVRGETLLSFGTTGWAGFLTHDLRNYFSDPHQSVEGSPYILDAYVEHLGLTLNWIRDGFFLDDQRAVDDGSGLSTSLERLDRKAAAISPGTDGLTVLPGFRIGPVQHRAGLETGVLYGLSLTHTPAHLYRALLESFGYSFRHAVERVEAEGIRVLRIACTGGGASSTIWRQIISDLTRRPLEFFSASGPCLGLAFLAAHSFGFLKSLDEINGWLPNKVITIPSPEIDPRYEEAYCRFRWLREALGRD
jgi:xylulokinase